MKHPPYYGLLAEFDSAGALTKAAEAAYHAGYRKMDAYTPFPVEEVSEAIGFHRSRLPIIVLAGGLLGMLGGFTLEYWVSAVAYPLNIAGRPLDSWIAFAVPAYECTILGAALSAVFGMLALNGLPQPYHPLFNIAEFSQVTRDKFYLCIEATDDKFDATATRALLDQSRPDHVWEVPH
jgi:ActD protein